MTFDKTKCRNSCEVKRRFEYGTEVMRICGGPCMEFGKHDPLTACVCHEHRGVKFLISPYRDDLLEPLEKERNAFLDKVAAVLKAEITRTITEWQEDHLDLPIRFWEGMGTSYLEIGEHDVDTIQPHHLTEDGYEDLDGVTVEDLEFLQALHHWYCKASDDFGICVGDIEIKPTGQEGGDGD